MVKKRFNKKKNPELIIRDKKSIKIEKRMTRKQISKFSKGANLLEVFEPDKWGMQRFGYA
jgi:hypothetical protein